MNECENHSTAGECFWISIYPNNNEFMYYHDYCQQMSRLIVQVTFYADELCFQIWLTLFFVTWTSAYAYLYTLYITRVGVNSGIEWELSSIPDSIRGIGLGIEIDKKGIGIKLELTKNARNW